ncbi:flavin reductase [Spongiivirga sp. MCCC 1A20706]|uniref:flavin reductase family protein n=1 Tax=Spongiivirga sp. MCCC 1A20706 TaxID=3160963 RepID=UPI0039775039
MHFTNQDIKTMDRVKRLKIMNSVSGIKPANLLGTVSSKGVENVAVFSSVFHLGSNPPLVGFILRPVDEVPRNTYDNFKENGQFTINHISTSFIKNAHYTSAKFPAEESEFEKCNLTPEYIANFKAPFVKESAFKMGLEFVQEIDIELNGTKMIVGEVQHLVVPETSYIDDDIDLAAIDVAGISGLNTYYSLKKIATFPYVRLSNFPDFEQ